MIIRIESPIHGAIVDPLCIRVSGTIALEAGERAPARLDAVVGGDVVGFTRILPKIETGNGEATHFFSILGIRYEGFGTSGVALSIIPKFADGSSGNGAQVAVSFIEFDHRTKDFGHLLGPEYSEYFHRQHVYASGPPAPKPSPFCVGLLLKYLEKPPARVLDAGCGIGAYAHPLRAAGYDWHGTEISESNCNSLAESGLPHTRVYNSDLPFSDREFDAAMAIEVLEHIPDPEKFVEELARVSPRLFISVPNFEILAPLQRYGVVPWHLLEADHKNFFTRWGLNTILSRYFETVEVITYGELPLRTPEGDSLHVHLFAIAQQ